MEIVLPLLVGLSTFASCVQSKCLPNNEKCEFWWSITYKLTMMEGDYLVYPFNRNLYLYNESSLNGSPVNIEDVITGDAWDNPRIAIVVNGQMPGPDMIVYFNQTIIVHVQNNLPDAGVSIHWHGLDQTGTPWMDGVSMITQCPILPYQNFTYTFRAMEVGSYWYHSHVGTQRSDGFFGALIIKNAPEPVIEEFILQVNEWNHNFDGNVNMLKIMSNFFHNGQLLNGTQSLDGNFLPVNIHSILINGRGQFNITSLNTDTAPPLTVFRVLPGIKYRFRVICVGFALPIRISIDGHLLTVVAADGYNLEPFQAESIVVNPAERIDFEITADSPVSSYWIRAAALVKDGPNDGLAILRYEGSNSQDPLSERWSCLNDKPCKIVNCPFASFPGNTNMTCLNFDNLKSRDKPAPEYREGKFKEFFLNFGFPDGQGSINAKNFEMPDVSALTQPQELITLCESTACKENEVCTCTHSISIGNNDTVQFIFANIGTGRGWAHPIHMHGHTYYVLKMVYGEYYETTGQTGPDTEDIKCNNRLCSDLSWKNPDWQNGNVPGLELEHPPRKDTIIVPTGGYVVLRIRASNPGVWFIHCHIEPHLILGMAMVLNESFIDVPEAPQGFPECRSFSGLQSQSPPQTESSSGDSTSTISNEQSRINTILIGIVLALILLGIISVIVVIYRRGQVKTTSSPPMELQASRS